MFRLKLENSNNKVIELTHNESRYQVLNVEGLNPPNANIRRTEFAGVDGSRYMSAKLEERNIVITVRINGDVETNRTLLYEYTRTKQWCKIYYSTRSKEAYCEGWVESNECNYFDIGVTMQISIVCPDPYFYAMQEIVTDISRIFGKFEFPFSFGAKGILSPTITDDAIEFSAYQDNRVTNVINHGSNGTGLFINIAIRGVVDSPRIYNFVTQQFIKINRSFIDRDVINIDTTPGRKSVKLIRNNVTINYINELDKNSTWLTLNNGDNLFVYDASSGATNMTVLFSYRPRYEVI